MTTSRTFRFQHLLLAALLWAGCDDPVSVPPISNPTGGKSGASSTQFEGPDVAVFTSGTSQSVEYFAEHPGQEAIDVEVLGAPAGADYAITDQDGAYSKKISLSWLPGTDAEGSLHVISLLARERASGREAEAAFDIYVLAP